MIAGLRRAAHQRSACGHMVVCRLLIHRGIVAAMMVETRAAPVLFGSLALLLFASLTGQERVATAGRVLGHGGKPLAGAIVTFVGSEPPLGDRFEPVDHVEVVTNDKGRFRVELRERFEYSCWAVGPAGPRAHRNVSEVFDVRPGSGFEMTLAHESVPLNLIVAGSDAWQDHGPLRFEVAVEAVHTHWLPVMLAEGRATLPALPSDRRWRLRVFDSAGMQQWCEVLIATTNDISFEMPPPQVIPVRVSDEQGKPVASAVIRVQTMCKLWRPNLLKLAVPQPVDWEIRGRTATDGTARVVVACQHDPFVDPHTDAPMLIASKAGYAGSLSGWNGQLIVNGSWIQNPTVTELAFTLPPAAAFAGRLIGLDGKPRRKQLIVLRCHSVFEMGGSVMRTPTAFYTHTAEDGTFSFASLPTIAAPVLRIASVDEATRAPILHSPALDQALELDFRQLATVELTVRNVAGEPARNADVIVMPMPVEDHLLDETTWRCRLDNHGTARLRVQPGEWSVIVSDRIGFVHRSVECRGARKLDLQLVPLAVVRGRVLINEADHVAGIRTKIAGASYTGAFGVEPSATLRAVGMRLNQWLAESTRVQDDGTFELRFLKVPDAHFSGRVTLGERYAGFRLRVHETPIDLTLRKP
jgi:hypothetical protein